MNLSSNLPQIVEAEPEPGYLAVWSPGSCAFLRCNRENHNSTSGYIPKGSKSRHLNRYLYINIKSSIIHNSQKRQKQPKYSLGEWINKTWKIHVMEYYSALKRNKILIHVIIWTNPEDMLSEKRGTKGQVL